MTLRVLTGPAALAYWPLVERGLAEWSETSDTAVGIAFLAGLVSAARQRITDPTSAPAGA